MSKIPNSQLSPSSLKDIRREIRQKVVDETRIVKLKDGEKPALTPSVLTKSTNTSPSRLNRSSTSINNTSSTNHLLSKAQLSLITYSTFGYAAPSSNPKTTSDDFLSSSMKRVLNLRESSGDASAQSLLYSPSRHQSLSIKESSLIDANFPKKSTSFTGSKLPTSNTFNNNNNSRAEFKIFQDTLSSVNIQKKASSPTRRSSEFQRMLNETITPVKTLDFSNAINPNEKPKKSSNLLKTQNGDNESQTNNNFIKEENNDNNNNTTVLDSIHPDNLDINTASNDKETQPPTDNKTNLKTDNKFLTYDDIFKDIKNKGSNESKINQKSKIPNNETTTAITPSDKDKQQTLITLLPEQNLESIYKALKEFNENDSNTLSNTYVEYLLKISSAIQEKFNNQSD